jgi:hypothetical protein
MKLTKLALLLCCLPMAAQTAPSAAPASFKSLSFLEGTWEARTAENGAVKASGLYAFKSELGGHVLARHSSTDPNCKGPASFDCAHGDLLYIFQDGEGQPLKAIYFDNEGHVIHYTVTTPTPTSAVFLSEPGPGPQFRLVYELKDASMNGKFQMQMPGQSEWRSYLEWSGAKK